MRRFRNLAGNDLLEGVDALAGAVDGVHEMHLCGFGGLQLRELGLVLFWYCSETRVRLESR